MLALILGLILFLGTHSIRIFADDWRSRQIARFGEKAWMAAYALLSLAGFLLLIWGYGEARLSPVVIWQPPLWAKHVTALLTLPAFVLLVAADVKGNKFKSAVGHPMVLGTKIWALAHLLSNGMAPDIVLFGSVLAWSVVYFSVKRRRDKSEGVQYPYLGIKRDIATVVLGILAWLLFASVLHTWWIGVNPMAK